MPSGTEADEPLQTRRERRNGDRKHENHLRTRRAEGARQERERVANRREKQRRVTRKERERLREEFENRNFVTRKGLWNIAKKRTLEDKATLPKEEGDLIREYKAMHEENCLSSWLREDVEGKAEEIATRNREDKR